MPLPATSTTKWHVTTSYTLLSVPEWKLITAQCALMSLCLCTLYVLASTFALRMTKDKTHVRQSVRVTTKHTTMKRKQSFTNECITAEWPNCWFYWV